MPKDSKKVRIARAALHFDEEPCISGGGGSGAIFFAGCHVRCVFCQNHSISRLLQGKDADSRRLAQIYQELIEQGAENINLVTADHYADAVVESFGYYRPPVPVIWNTGGYVRPALLQKLAPFIDVYLADLKFTDRETAKRYCAHEDYFAVAATAIREMRRLSGKAVFDSRGLIRRGTIVRHLILPNAVENAKRAIDFVASLPETPISLMAQYLPWGEAAAYPEINRTLRPEEYGQVQSYLFATGLDGWVQDLSSADASYIPEFNGCGV
ncbi:MAG: 4Fe-4S cluster-binding domain-containing protein [Firmicutes bacterium]|nr:4Fe-4S cluster-binding domain-containing protein [Bacillota bacterium]